MSSYRNIVALSFLGWGNFFWSLSHHITDGLKTWPALTENCGIILYLVISCQVSFSLLRGCNILALEYGLLLVLVLVKVNSRRHSGRYAHGAEGLDSWIVVCAGVDGLLEQERLLFSSVGSVGKSGKYTTGVSAESISSCVPAWCTLHTLLSWSSAARSFPSSFSAGALANKLPVVLVCTDVLRVCSCYCTALELA